MLIEPSPSDKNLHECSLNRSRDVAYVGHQTPTRYYVILD